MNHIVTIPTPEGYVSVPDATRRIIEFFRPGVVERAAKAIHQKEKADYDRWCLHMKGAERLLVTALAQGDLAAWVVDGERKIEVDQPYWNFDRHQSLRNGPGRPTRWREIGDAAKATLADSRVFRREGLHGKRCFIEEVAFYRWLRQLRSKSPEEMLAEATQGSPRAEGMEGLAFDGILATSAVSVPGETIQAQASAEVAGSRAPATMDAPVRRPQRKTIKMRRAVKPIVSRLIANGQMGGPKEDICKLVRAEAMRDPNNKSLEFPKSRQGMWPIIKAAEAEICKKMQQNRELLRKKKWPKSLLNLDTPARNQLRFVPYYG
jgi:hypothetical protein